MNEADPNVMAMQIDVATNHGVNVFIFDWYWYDGRPFMETTKRGSLQKHVENTADLTTDDSTTYPQLKEHVHSNTATVIPHEELPNVLPWVHTAISNAKRQLLGVYYKMKPVYLQYYLNQFSYKFNRRYFGEKLFDRLLVAALTYTPDFKSRTYNRN